MTTLIFATNNHHKVEEMQAAVGNSFTIKTLKETGINIDIPEPHNTLEANAFEKANTIFQLTGHNCFSEDTGLEVEALNGEPGIKSARYAGEDKDFNSNILKLLKNLEGSLNRKARFRTVISLIWNSKVYTFEGVCNGRITSVLSGNRGFGYDPVFIPDGADKTFAEMTLEEKNKYSHRKKAADRLLLFLFKEKS